MNKLLLIEDEQDLQDLYSTIIQNCGYYPEVYSCYEHFDVRKINEFAAYMLDDGMKYGPNGSEWMVHNHIYLPVKKRILNSAGNGWDKFQGIKLHKPTSIRNIEEAVLLATIDGDLE